MAAKGTACPITGRLSEASASISPFPFHLSESIDPRLSNLRGAGEPPHHTGLTGPETVQIDRGAAAQ